MCGSPAAAPAGGGRRLSRTQNGEEERKGIDCGWHPDQSCLVRVPLRALSFPPKNFEFAEDTYIQETMSSYAHLVLKKKKKRKERKTALPSSPRSLLSPNKQSIPARMDWSRGTPKMRTKGFPPGQPFLPGLLHQHLPTSLRGVGAECDPRTSQSRSEHLHPKHPWIGQPSVTLSPLPSYL